mmetsp:Transcript_66864/g.186875  ORF Transcript_66864/g.186875 Transcript_66864/m.186875 type:complete len:211 (+) Transcript_66864:210-842(+)
MGLLVHQVLVVLPRLGSVDECELLLRDRAQERLQHPPDGLSRPREVHDGDPADTLRVHCAQHVGRGLHRAHVQIQMRLKAVHVHHERHCPHVSCEPASGLECDQQLVAHDGQALGLAPRAHVDDGVALQVPPDDPHVGAHLAPHGSEELRVLRPELERRHKHLHGLLRVVHVRLQHPPRGGDVGPLELNLGLPAQLDDPPAPLVPGVFQH